MFTLVVVSICPVIGWISFSIWPERLGSGLLGIRSRFTIVSFVVLLSIAELVVCHVYDVVFIIWSTVLSWCVSLVYSICLNAL